MCTIERSETGKHKEKYLKAKARVREGRLFTRPNVKQKGKDSATLRGGMTRERMGLKDCKEDSQN